MLLSPNTELLEPLGLGLRGDTDVVELPLGEGRSVLASGRAEDVEQCFRQCLMRYYADFRDAGQEGQLAFQREVLKTLNKFYVCTANSECLAEVARLIDKVGEAAALGDKNSAKLDKMGVGRQHEKREKVAYQRDLKHCFEVASGCDKALVQDCLAEICKTIVMDYALDATTFNAIPAVLCGEKRDVVLKSAGNAEATRIAVAVLVHTLVEEKRICRPAAGLTTWQAATQAFLNSSEKPYADDNFSKAHRNNAPGPEIHKLVVGMLGEKALRASVK